MINIDRLENLRHCCDEKTAYTIFHKNRLMLRDRRYVSPGGLSSTLPNGTILHLHCRGFRWFWCPFLANGRHTHTPACRDWHPVGVWVLQKPRVLQRVRGYASNTARHWYSGGRHSRLCSHFAWVGGRVLFAFVVAININTGCWWLLWSNPPGLAQQAFARGSGVGYSAGGGALPSWWWCTCSA